MTNETKATHTPGVMIFEPANQGRESRNGIGLYVVPDRDALFGQQVLFVPEVGNDEGSTMLANAERAARAWNCHDELIEALRRYMLMDEIGGEEALQAEFGAPEFPESSSCMDAWLERVLRGPARATIAKARGAE